MLGGEIDNYPIIIVIVTIIIIGLTIILAFNLCILFTTQSDMFHA